MAFKIEFVNAPSPKVTPAGQYAPNTGKGIKDTTETRSSGWKRIARNNLVAVKKAARAIG